MNHLDIIDMRYVVGEWVWILLVSWTEWKKIMDYNLTVCKEKLLTR